MNDNDHTNPETWVTPDIEPTTSADSRADRPDILVRDSEVIVSGDI